MIYYLVFVCSFVLTYIIRTYAKKKSILDIPNHRSSHKLPTPRGGGLAIVLSFFIGLLYLFMNDYVDQKLFFALLSSVPLLIVSLLDDMYTLSSKIRFLVQIISVFLALYFLDSINLIYAFLMLWLINLYNFLDGIDGYAAMEAVYVSIASYFIFTDTVLLLLGLATLGFLPYNWQRASIFMGDVGSTFMGFVFGVFILYFSHDISDFIIWILLLGLFIFDATFTLIKRLLKNEDIFKAHNKHIYQRAVQVGLSHQQVVLFALFINLILFMITGLLI